MSGIVNSFNFSITPGKKSISRGDFNFTGNLGLSETITLINLFNSLSNSFNVQEIKEQEMKEIIPFTYSNDSITIIRMSENRFQEKILQAWRRFSSIGVYGSDGIAYYRIVFPKALSLPLINSNNPVFNEHSYPCCSCKSFYYGRAFCKHIKWLLQSIDIPIEEISEIELQDVKLQVLEEMQGFDEYQWIP